MTDSDNGDYLSDGAEEIEATMIEAQSEQQTIEKDALSMQEGSISRSSSSSNPNSRPSSVTAAGRKSGTTDELVAGAEAISSDDEENSDVEDGEVPQSSFDSPKRSSPEAPPPKKQKPEPREDLEDGEIETDSEDEKEAEQQQSPPQQQQYHQQYQQPQPLMSLHTKPLITPPMLLRNNNRQFNNNRLKVDFPRNQQNNNNQQNNSNKRKRPEDCGVCKFYLRGNCTWNDKCKYNHPLGGQRIQWLAELGLPDPDIGYNPNRPRKTDTSKQNRKSSSPKDVSPRVSKRNRRQNGSERTEPKKSPRASPISSADEGSRSPSPKRVRASPTAISVSSDDSRPPSRARTPLSLSPEGKRRIRSSSSERGSRSRSPITSSKTTDTTLGALLRKRRLESQSKPSQDSSSYLPGNISESDDEEDDTPAPPKNRAEAVRRFFNRDPNEIPSIFQPSKILSPPQSPTPQSITSSEDERDNEVFKSPSPPPRNGSESPVLATI